MACLRSWWHPALVLLAACSERANPPPADAATGDASPGGDLSIVEASPPSPSELAVVVVRPGGPNAVNHLECAMNAAGDGVAVWREADIDFRPQPWGSRLAATGWLPAERLGMRVTMEIDGPLAGVGGDGRVLALWNESGGSDNGVVATTHTPGTGWGTPSRVSGGWVSAVIAAPGGQAVAFGALEGAPPTLLRYAPPSGWAADAAFRLERPGSFFAGPTGDGVLAWNQPTLAGTGASELHVAEYRASGTWGAPLRLQETAPLDHPLPILNASVAPDRSAVLLWNRGGEAAGTLWAAARAATGIWAPARQLQAGEALQWTTTVAAVDGGAALVVWETGVSPRKRVWAATHRSGGAWSDAVMLADRSELVTGALGAGGDALVAWSTAGNVYGRRFTPAGGWGPPRAAMGNNSGLADLCAVIDGGGRGWLVWINGSPQAVRAAALID